MSGDYKACRLLKYIEYIDAFCILLNDLSSRSSIFKEAFNRNKYKMPYMMGQGADQLLFTIRFHFGVAIFLDIKKGHTSMMRRVYKHNIPLVLVEYDWWI